MAVQVPEFTAAALKYWHPVCRSRALRDKPLAARLAGQDLVLFRDAKGTCAALEDRCAHRRMRLSKGCVAGDRIVCPYHSWSFAADGRACSPGNPQLAPRVKAYDVIERHGFCWIKERSSETDMPVLEFEDFERVHEVHMPVGAPFRLLVDNMAELEHTIAVHSIFGFGFSDITQVKTSTGISDSKDLTIYYEGPQRDVPAYLTWFTGIRGGDRFVQQAVLRFGPVHATYELCWFARGANDRRRFALRFVIFYNPVDAQSCEMFAFVYLAKTFPKWLSPFVVPVLRRVVEGELTSDKLLVESLTRDALDSEQHQLGRFDVPLIEARKLIRNHYLGLENAP